MKKWIPTMLVVFACIAVSSCKSNQKKGNDSVATDTAKMAEDHADNNAGSGGYSIMAPAGWEKKDTTISDSPFTTIKSPLEGDNDNFRENLTVTTENTQGADLTAYVDLSRANLLKQYPSAEILTDGETTINGVPAKWLVYSFNYSGYDLKNTVYIMVKNGMSYVVTCTALKNTFDKYQADFKTCVNSFKIN
jgi:hypothetical protein